MSLPGSGTQLLVSERFVSLQGEGASAGAPAAFLRLGNCNLSCVYCDTPYTWDTTRYDLKEELVPLDVAEVAAWVIDHAPGRLIVTGGEPLLQHKLLSQLLLAVDQPLAARGARRLIVEVETNATVLPSAALLARIDQWNVSPKLGTSGEPAERRIKPAVLEAFSGLGHAYFKFVVTSDPDVAEVNQLIERFGLTRERVMFMPEATGPEQLRLRAPQVAAWALSERVRYSGRLHLELYGGRRGT